MKRISILTIQLLLQLAVWAQTPQIIPQPVELIKGQGSFTINEKTGINLAVQDKEIRSVADKLNVALKRAAGFELNTNSQPGNNVIHFNLSATAGLGDEGYILSINSERIQILAEKPAGLFYAVQSILQLLPKEIESKNAQSGIQWSIPAVEIRDKPRFGWRGAMLDVSRHFFTKQEVKQFIDDIARYKYNLLHFHLTDDQGWRIEIKSYPKLTEVGAWNVKKTGRFGTFAPPADTEPRDYGGFYTQDDIRELVQYARERYVNILPEIDVPGHSMAAVASYPDLSCTPGTYKVNSGEPFMDWHGNGQFTARIDNTLCPANEKVYTFLDKVFSEVSTLFPFPYIHMGGDECAKNFWEKNSQIKELMTREKLKDMHAVQSYFVGRVSKIVSSKGKKLIGWDEILEGGLVKDAAVMSWRGMKGGIEAAKMGHEVVMTPTTHVYVDYMQGDAAIEPPVYASLRLKKSYEFEPVPEGVDPKLIKGGQANMWTEQIYNTRHLDYMMWPRGFAIAEALWSPPAQRNWKGFLPRVEAQFDRFTVADKKFAPSIYEADIKVKKDAAGKLMLDLLTEMDDLKVHYSFDNSFPDDHYPSYSGMSIQVPTDATTLKIQSYRNGMPVGRIISVGIEDLKKRK